MTYSHDRDTRTYAAISWSMTGDTARSQKLVDELMQYPNDFVLNQVSLRMARALQALHHNQPAEAIHFLKTTEP